MSDPPTNHGSDSAFGVEVRSYHGQPVLKEPVWSWEIPTYFYLGGMAGASAGLGLLSGLRGNDVLARRAWAAAMAGLTISPALLTLDLGRPTRFLKMLRMFKVTSPMSVGSWILTGSGGATALAATNAWLGRFPRLGRLAKPAAAVLGLPLATYTGALVATAIPVWHEARRAAVLFRLRGGSERRSDRGHCHPRVPCRPGPSAGSGRSGPGGSADGAHDSPARRARRDLQARHAGPPGQHQPRGHPGWRTPPGRQGRLLPRRGRGRGTLLSIGALATRWSVFKVGFASAADPRYVIGAQRAPHPAGESRGAARTTPGVSQAKPAAGSPALTIGQ